MNDAEIIVRSTNAPEAFGEIFDRHFDAVAGFCRRRVGSALGEDIAGNVFRWAFENRARFDRSRESARPWLLGIANNFVRDALRAVGRQKLAYERWSAREPGGGTEIASQVADSVDAQRDLVSVFRALNQQPAEDIETILLFAWEQLTYVEIAEVLEIPVGTVRSRIHRVRRQLEQAMGTSLVKTSEANYSTGDPA